MYSEHQKDIFLQTELHTYKLHSYSWLCKYPTRDKQMNTDLTQQIQTCAVLKSSHLSSGICLLWLGFLFPHFLSTPNTESTFFKKSSTEKSTLLLHPQAAGLWSTVTASRKPASLCHSSPSAISQLAHSNPRRAIAVTPPAVTGITFARKNTSFS